MTESHIITELKYLLSIIGYVLIVYPTKRFIYPLLSWAIENAYLFGACFFGYLLIYLYDGDASKIANDLTTKLLSEDMWAINLLLNPFVTIGGYPISPANLLLATLFLIIIIKIYEFVFLFFRQIKQVLGDVLLVILWCYYTIFGRREESVMLISGNEAKIKLYMYAIIFIVIVISASIILLPKLLFNPVTTTTPLVINNTSIDLQHFQWVIP